MIDSHCHLDHEPLLSDLENVIQRSKKIGIKKLLTISTSIESFKIHIKAALEANIPLIIHSRNAEEKTYEVLNEYKDEKLKILMHCFTGSQKFAEKLLKFNSYFSASGIITFKNSVDLQNTF